MGFDLKDIAWLDLSPTPEFFTEIETYDIFSPAEVEREPITQKIMEHIETHKPQRVFMDDMTRFRYLTTDPYQFRKQVLSFVRYLVRHGATVVFTSESSLQEPDDDLQFMADVVIDLNFNGYERIVRIIKLSGSGFRSGRHAMILGSKGMIVYPGLVPAEHKVEFASKVIFSGVPELDELLNGGLSREQSTSSAALLGWASRP